MNPHPNTPSIISAQKISAQKISAHMSESETASVPRRLVEVPVGDIDATIAIMEALAQFCAGDPAAERFARLFSQRIHEFEIATLAEGLAAAFTHRLTTPATSRTEP
jgi:hypothetical protein